MNKISQQETDIENQRLVSAVSNRFPSHDLLFLIQVILLTNESYLFSPFQIFKVFISFLPKWIGTFVIRAEIWWVSMFLTMTCCKVHASSWFDFLSKSGNIYWKTTLTVALVWIFCDCMYILNIVYAVIADRFIKYPYFDSRIVGLCNSVCATNLYR